MRRLAVSDIRVDVIGRHVDVDLVLADRVDRQGVRATVGLDRAHVPRAHRVGHVEDLDALPVVGVTGRWLARARVVGTARVGRQNSRLPDRHVVLRAGTQHLGHQSRLGRLLEVPDAEAVVVALVGVVAGEREVGVRGVERRRLGRARQERHVLAGADSFGPGMLEPASAGVAPSTSTLAQATRQDYVVGCAVGVGSWGPSGRHRRGVPRQVVG